MRVPLSLRIFLVNALFTIGIGALAFVLVERSFEHYYERWTDSVATLPSEELFQASANEVARALLLRLEKPAEIKDRDQDRIVLGLNAILKEIPSIRGFVVVDRDLRIQYSNQVKDIDLGFTGDRAALFDSDKIERRTTSHAGGDATTEVMVPIFDKAAEGAPPRRLGSLLMVYAPDAPLVGRLPQLRPPRVLPSDSMDALVFLLLAGIAGGLLIAGLTALPVRRLDRALADFRKRGFRGGLKVDGMGIGMGMGGEIASAVSAINEMGGRMEAMDERAREREALLASLSQSLEEGMLAIDDRGMPVAWNEAALRIIGLPEGADEKALRAALDRHKELAIGWSAGSTLEARIVDIPREGTDPLPVQIAEVPFESRPGALGTLVLLRDLATLRKVETHLLEAGRFAVLAHLAGSLAHEIRNPLHAIGLSAGAVQQYVGRPQTETSQRAVAESLSTIQEETRRLTELLNNYLGMLRSAPQPGPVDVRDVCRRVMQLLTHEAMVAGVEMELSGETDLPEVYGVPDSLQQAVLNLVLNAIQAMPRGGRVALQTSAGNGLVRLSVTDTGPGLPPELADRIFESRVTTKDGGSGLGLPLVRMIAEAHGGSVRYRSDPGQGATFTLVLPSGREAA